MTSNPIYISKDALLKDAITLMEDRKSQISVLPVVNGDGKSCVGLLRLHDIYQTHLF
jgi:arabinose-5-phosphate isomerase